VRSRRGRARRAARTRDRDRPDRDRISRRERVIDVSKPDVPDITDWVKRELDDLRRMRDELRVQAHLGKREMSVRWEALERAFDTLESKARYAARAAEEP